MKFNPTNYPIIQPSLDDTLMVRESTTGEIKSATVRSMAAATTISLVENISGLRALSVDGIANGATIMTAGYYADSDGGGGQFNYDRLSLEDDNGGTVISPNSGPGRWIRNVTSGLIDVLWFGAKGDGVSNDTSFINKADAIAASLRYELFIPGGTYLVTALVFNSPLIQGSGRDRTILRGSTAGDHVVRINAGGTYLRDLKITSSVSTSLRTGCGLYVPGGAQCLIRDVEIIGHFHGIWNQGQGNEYEHVISASNRVHGFFLDGSVLAQNEMGIYFCQSNGNGGDGFHVVGPGQGLRMDTCTSASNGGIAMYFSAGMNDVWISTAEISSCAGGIFIDSGCSIYQIVNAFVEAFSNYAGIHILSPLCTIVGGYIQAGTNASFGGIYVNHSDVSIAGCQLSSNAGYGIYFGANSARVELSSIGISNTAATGNTTLVGLNIDPSAGPIVMSSINMALIVTPLVGSIPIGSMVRGCPGISDYNISVRESFGKFRQPVTLATGLNSDVNINNASFVEITGPGGAYSVGGFTSPEDGQELTIYSKTSSALTIVNEDASSTAANRILTLTGSNVTAKKIATFIYSLSEARWLLRSFNP